MEIALIGMGKMGANMTRRLLRGGIRVVAHDRKDTAVAAMEAEGAVGARSFEEAAQKLSTPRAVWLMLPAGEVTERALWRFAELLEPGDILIDGGNSNYKDSQRRAAQLAERGLHFVDVGTSGGVWGLTEGYSLMIGGAPAAVAHLRPVFETLAPAVERGWGHVGPSGSGHFVKMIHNGIEYGIMQAYAEGFDLLKNKAEFGLDLHQITQIWQHGSVVRSWLLDLAERALAENPDLDGVAAYVPDSGEGRWTVMEGIEQSISIPVITAALERRFRSRQAAPFSDKLLQALRNQFGGHAVVKE